MKYGRKRFSFSGGKTILTSVTVTEKSQPGEDEEAFFRRLMKKFGDQQGTVEIVFKNGRPDYAIIKLS